MQQNYNDTIILTFKHRGQEEFIKKYIRTPFKTIHCIEKGKTKEMLLHKGGIGGLAFAHLGKGDYVLYPQKMGCYTVFKVGTKQRYYKIGTLTHAPKKDGLNAINFYCPMSNNYFNVNTNKNKNFSKISLDNAN